MRLSNATLDQLPGEVLRPGYDRTAVKTGVVHLGLGAFHRAHQAAVFEAALDAGDLRWGVTGVSLRSPQVRDQLAPQDGLYTLLVRDGDRETARVIGAVRDVLVAPENPQAVVAAIAAPDTQIVTLTITEKGYKLDRGTDSLETGDPGIAHDLASLDAPQTAPGFLVAGLAVRRAKGLGPLTIISCDNLPENGRLLRGAVLAMARAHDPVLAAWIAKEVAFPATMVDRIVPATTSDDIAALAATLGVEDRAMVKTEPFTQWVVEDWFAGPRPDLAAFGVQLTNDVAGWEAAKLRLLNGAHSSIAYLGGLAGVEFVHEFVAHEVGRRFVEALWDEAEVTLEPPPGLDVPAYRSALMARFANTALQHRTRQIAMDGSQKLPQRLVSPIVERRREGRGAPALSLGVAAWMRWQEGRDDAGTAFTVDDPRAEVTARAVRPDARETVDAMLAIEAIFPPQLAANEAYKEKLAGQLAMLRDAGACVTLRRFVDNLAG